MRILPIALFSLLTVFVCSCGGGGGGSSDSSESTGVCDAFKILNGSECANDTLPVVSLVIDDVLRCTGTIISNDAVLTAAHCAAQKSAVAEHGHGTQSSTLSTAHPLANVSPAFDIAIISFPNIAKNFGVTPARFGLSRRTESGDKLKVIGYGIDGSSTLANENPRGTELIVSDVRNGLVVTSFDTTNSSPCHGDSGGAATLNGLIVAAVHGGGLPDGTDSCAAGSIAIFADLQIQENIDFIKSQAPGATFE